MSLTMADARRLQGSTLLGAGGSKIGKVADVYIDADTQEPEWALVNTGLFGSRESFVPLAEATTQGDDIAVPYDKDMVKGAPNAEPDGELSQEEEAALYRHYGLPYSEAASDSGLPVTGTTQTTQTAQQAQPVAAAPAPARTDDAMTLSEERLRVSKIRRPSQLVRLRKHIVTENVSTTVPVTREEVRVVREPVSGGVAGNVELSEQVAEVTLHAERPVVEKEVVATERVRVAKDVVTEQVQVSDTVRHEEVAVEEAGTESTSTTRTAGYDDGTPVDPTSGARR